MESSEISLHQARIYRFLRGETGWVTARQIAAGADVAVRTARLHALRFVRLMIADEVAVSPEHRYRLSALADKRNAAYLGRLEQALKVFGLS